MNGIADIYIREAKSGYRQNTIGKTEVFENEEVLTKLDRIRNKNLRRELNICCINDRIQENMRKLGSNKS